MDAAIKQAENKAVQRVTQLFEARELVKPLVGAVAMDSAEAVLKHALKKSGIDSDGVDTVKGLKTLVGLTIKLNSQVAHLKRLKVQIFLITQNIKTF